MSLLERIWEALTVFFGGLLTGFEKVLTRLFGSSNARTVKQLQQNVDRINELEPTYEKMSEDELREQTQKFRKRLADGETLDDILVEAFAVCREGGKRFLGMRHYDVQLMGGMVLHGGNIAEMVTGEGKTLVATLPAYLNALEGRGVHVVTVNDYLARRDMEWMAPLYMGLGLTVGAIQSNMPPDERQEAYKKDITYGTNNEFGFDYLRDNMRDAARGDERFPAYQQQSQGPLNFAIIDEVDNILIDEARTPLIISGPARQDAVKYADADRISRRLVKDLHFEVKEKEHTVLLTDEGVREAEKLAGVESFYTTGNMEWPHLIDNSLKAHHLYKKDVNYIVKDDEIIIIDEFTGRQMPGRQWSDGLHQAVEAKEGVKIKEETQTLATITLQNLFKLYKKASGMTGTAMTEASEFWKIYKMDVIAIPTNRSMQRKVSPDLVFPTEQGKYKAIIEDIERISKWDILELEGDEERVGKIIKETDNDVTIQLANSSQKQTISREKIQHISRSGRPVLVGTVSIEKSERISHALQRRGIKHEVLNAKNHGREADIVSQAGRKGAVTIATNMAGRGTDIVLGGNPETMAWSQLQDKYPTRLDVPPEEWEKLVNEIEQKEGMKQEGREVAAMGGLHVIGTERHEARRIDLQLIGRCGRQGDPGSARFYLSLEDDLMRLFAGDFVKKMFSYAGIKEDEAIESGMVTRQIARAQKKVEGRNFDIRKSLLEYDEVMDEQRKRVYRYRQRILEGESCKNLLQEMVERQIKSAVDRYLHRDFGPEAFAAFVGSPNKFGIQFDARDFRDSTFEEADRFARDEVEDKTESLIVDAVEENLPEEEDSSEWNWGALARWANARYGLNLRDRDLKKVGRDDIMEFLKEKALESARKVDLSEGATYLEADYGLRSLCQWAQKKFEIELDYEELKEVENEAIRQRISKAAVEAYEQREVEFPVTFCMSQATTAEGAADHFDREKCLEIANSRFASDLSLDVFKNKQRNEIREVLLQSSKKYLAEAPAKFEAVQQKLEEIFGSEDDEEHPADRPAAIAAGSNGKLDELAAWLRENLNDRADPEELGRLNREELQRRLYWAVEHRYNPEIRFAERRLLLILLDSAWKDHLLVMDHLKHAIGLRGFAQIDPKVEYKREGMRMFEEMWQNIGDRATDLFFHMEIKPQEPPKAASSTWADAQARHDEAPSAVTNSPDEDGSDESQPKPQKVETIRNYDNLPGRNEKCPCGSGKKFKNCCQPLIRAGKPPRWKTQANKTPVA